MSDFGIKIITGNEEFHTRELGLKMIDFKIPQPDAKTNYVQIPGTSGNLDLSEVYGGVDMKIETDCRLLLLYVTIL